MPTIRLKDDQNVWNFILSIFFLAAMIPAWWWVLVLRGAFPHAVSGFDAILMVLASFRITRLLVYDKITRWFRELFLVRREYVENGEMWVELKPLRYGIRSTIYDLLSCPWCVGFWSSLIVVFCYFCFDWAWIMILFLALAGAGSFVQLLANVIGWQIENLKLDAHAKEKNIDQVVDRSSVGK